MRVTVAELRACFVDYVKVVQSLGIDVSEYHMIEGSRTQGQQYRVLNKGTDALAIRSGGFIGHTRLEAVTELRNITAGMRHAREALLNLPITTR